MSSLFDLPPAVDAAVKAEFTDSRGCKAWLALLPLINVRQSHAELLEALKGFNRVTVPALDRLKCLELLREPVAFVQEENAKKYINRPLPLVQLEADTWAANMAIWVEMTVGYTRCFEAALQGDAQVADYTHLIAQRCLRYSGLQVREYYFAYRPVPGALWQKMHRLYMTAEAAGVTMRAVKDSQNEGVEATTAQAAYVQALLLSLTSPCSLSTKATQMTDRWLSRWAVQNHLDGDINPDGPEPWLRVDFRLPRAFERVAGEAETGEYLRYLDTEHLRRSLRKRIKVLRDGGVPEQLGLGTEWSAEACEAHLQYLAQQWVEFGSERVYPRRPIEGKAQVAFSLAAMHFFISGDAFTPPERGPGLHGQARIDFEVFRDVSSRTRRTSASQLGYAVETWELTDESAQGFGLSRPAEDGVRIAHNQLMAIRTPDVKHFTVGSVRWLLLGNEGNLLVGTRMLPGIPEAIAVRPSGLAPQGMNKSTQALLLPAVPALKQDASLVIPAGWFRQGRILEVYRSGHEMERVKLTTVVERGVDFERVQFLGNGGAPSRLGT